MGADLFQERLRQVFGDYDRIKPYDTIFVREAYEVVCPHLPNTVVEHFGMEIPESLELHSTVVKLNKTNWGQRVGQCDHCGKVYYSN